MRLTKMTGWLCILLVLGCVLASGVHGEQGRIMLQEPPHFQPVLGQNGQPQRIQAGQIEQQFRKSSPTLAEFYRNRQIDSYLVPDGQWLGQWLATFLDNMWTLGLSWRPESWDCDNFSILFNSFTTLRLWEAGWTDSHCALGWLLVDGKTAWEGVPPGSHALVFAYTGQGLVIIEPQTGRVVALADYPNHQFIKKVFLF